jgi:hypothetical protein
MMKLHHMSTYYLFQFLIVLQASCCFSSTEALGRESIALVTSFITWEIVVCYPAFGCIAWLASGPAVDKENADLTAYVPDGRDNCIKAGCLLPLRFCLLEACLAFELGVFHMVMHLLNLVS